MTRLFLRMLPETGAVWALVRVASDADINVPVWASDTLEATISEPSFWLHSFLYFLHTVKIAGIRIKHGQTFK